MLERINHELVVQDIEHPAITLNQMRTCIKRAEEEEMSVIDFVT